MAQLLVVGWPNRVDRIAMLPRRVAGGLPTPPFWRVRGPARGRRARTARASPAPCGRPSRRRAGSTTPLSAGGAILRQPRLGRRCAAQLPLRLGRGGSRPRRQVAARQRSRRHVRSRCLQSELEGVDPPDAGEKVAEKFTDRSSGSSCPGGVGHFHARGASGVRGAIGKTLQSSTLTHHR
jgi:hypothetical protein